MGKIDEMLRSKSAPANHTFRPRVIENLTQEPVLVTSHAQHRRLMKEANAEYIGDHGQREALEKAMDHRSDRVRNLRSERDKSDSVVTKGGKTCRTRARRSRRS